MKGYHGTKSKIEFKNEYIIKSVNAKDFSKMELNNEIAVLNALDKENFKYHARMVDMEADRYIKMEYIEGTLLADLLRFEITNLSKKELYQIGENVASTLTSFYKTGFIHNDLAATNIIIKRNSNEAYLIDYGRAGTDGCLEKDLGYFLGNIVKVRCEGNAYINLLMYSKKCEFFIDVYFNMFEHTDGFSKHKYFLNIIKEFYLSELHIVKNREFSGKMKLKILLLILPTIVLSNIKYLARKYDI